MTCTMPPEDPGVMEEEGAHCSSTTETLSYFTGDDDTIPSEERHVMWENDRVHRAWVQEWMQREERQRKSRLERETCVASHTLSRCFRTALAALQLAGNQVSDWLCSQVG